MVQVYNTCNHFIRTIPLLQSDENNIEDIDSDLEDHVYDEACHIFMARPIVPKITKVKQSSYDKRIDALYKPKGDSFENALIWEAHVTHNILQPGGVEGLDAEEYEDGMMIPTVE
jgi:hypothetical protein